MNVLRVAAPSSAVRSAAQRVAAGSILCAAATSTFRAYGDLRNRIAIGLGGAWSGEREHRGALLVHAVAADSRVISALSTLLAAPSRAREGARSRRLLAPFLGLDAPGRLSAAGQVLIVAVLTHTAVLALLRAPVHLLGWSVRGGLIVLGLFLARNPNGAAAAWKDKAESLDR